MDAHGAGGAEGALAEGALAGEISLGLDLGCSTPASDAAAAEDEAGMGSSAEAAAEDEAGMGSSAEAAAEDEAGMGTSAGPADEDEAGMGTTAGTGTTTSASGHEGNEAGKGT